MAKGQGLLEPAQKMGAVPDPSAQPADVSDLQLVRHVEMVQSDEWLDP
jgi:hypothetical protein